MPATNTINIASGPNAESYVPDQLRAGDGDFNTNTATVSSGLSLAQYAVVARKADGELVVWDPTNVTDPDTPAATDGSEHAVGILCYAVDATAADKVAAYYVSGYFNTDALVWPAGVTALQKATAFDRTAIKHRALVNSMGGG